MEKSEKEPEEILQEEFSFKSKEDLKSVLIRLPEILIEKEMVMFNTEVQKGDLISVTKTLEEDAASAVAKETILLKTEVKVDKRAMSKEEKLNYKPKFIDEIVPKYTNEMQRQASVNVLLLNNARYNDLRAKADRLDKWLSKAKINLSYIKRVFRVANSLTRLE